MLSVGEVWSLIDREVRPLPLIRKPLGQALWHRLAEDIRADADMPAFSRSAIDGYALGEGSAPGWVRVVAEVRPGMPPFSAPTVGEAVRIFTGSALPDEGIGLVMVEDTESDADRVRVRVAATRQHVRSRGSQAKRGDVLLGAGTQVNPGAIGLLASVGATNPLVSSRPRVLHLVTGSELVPANVEPEPGFIRDSNSPLVAALLAQAGATEFLQRHVSESVEDAVRAAESADADLVLISGGASVGAYDGTMEILKRLGFSVLCSKVRSRPGKPLIFARRDSCAAFGLPGNPLSHFVCFHLFVRRALDLMSRGVPQQTTCVRLEGEPPPADPRETWWPARVKASNGFLSAKPIPWRDSSDLSRLASANALLRIGIGDANELVEALLIDTLD